MDDFFLYKLFVAYEMKKPKSHSLRTWNFGFYIELLNKCQFDFPVKVKAIYLGDNFLPSNIPRMVEISNKLNCELYQMTAPNHTEKSYSFIPKKIK